MWMRGCVCTYCTHALWYVKVRLFSGACASVIEGIKGIQFTIKVDNCPFLQQPTKLICDRVKLNVGQSKFYLLDNLTIQIWNLILNTVRFYGHCRNVCVKMEMEMWCVCLCRFRKWFVTSMEGVWKHLLRKSQPENLVFIGEERETGEFYPKMVGVQNFIWSLPCSIPKCP